MSFFTKHENNKPLIPRKPDNSILDKLVKFIEAEFLPDNLAIGVYQNDRMDYDVTILGYINRKKKRIKLKLVTDYAIICFEED